MSFWNLVWRTYSNAAGVLLVAGIATYAILLAFAYNGPVVENIEGPANVTMTVPQGGELSFTFSVRRNASCPGRVIHRLVSRNDNDPGSLVIPVPIISTDIKTTNDATVRLRLPPSIYPGTWLYQYIVDSQCPTYRRQDELANFMIEVVPK